MTTKVKKKEKLAIKFQPNLNWILLPDPTTKKTESGIILDPSVARENSTNIIKVLKTGPTCSFVKVGDVIMIDPRTQAVVTEIEEVSYLLVQEHQILGKL